MSWTAYAELTFLREFTPEEIVVLHTNRMIHDADRHNLVIELGITVDNNIASLHEQYYFFANTKAPLETYFNHPYYTSRIDFLKEWSADNGNIIIFNNPIDTITEI